MEYGTAREEGAQALIYCVHTHVVNLIKYTFLFVRWLPTG